MKLFYDTSFIESFHQNYDGLIAPWFCRIAFVPYSESRRKQRANFLPSFRRQHSIGPTMALVPFLLGQVFLVATLISSNAVHCATTTTTTTTAVTVCPKQGSLTDGLKYHQDTVCNRHAYNVYKSNIGRHNRIQAYKEVGGMGTVVSQKTITCPAQGARVNMKEAHAPNVGLDTVWFVENRASTPVVVSYVNDNGVEVSARNPKISPSLSDPTSILKPGEWMAVYAFEGHEFVVREVLSGGMAGNVLLQHRVGLIPVGVNAAARGLSCPASQSDIEPMMNETVTAPIFQRTPTELNRPCNTMDIGFRNVASCPLHGYYVRGEGDRCEERFKFHLGVESITDDFIKDWVSPTKFEGTYIGHTFHFRLASNPTVLVDTITVQPIYVTDCPMSSTTAVVAESTGATVMAQVGHFEVSNWTDPSGTYEMVYSTNSTSRMGHLPLDKPVSPNAIESMK
jgi:hypothetical protein